MVSLYIIIFSYMFRPYIVHHQGETWLQETRMTSIYISSTEHSSGITKQLSLGIDTMIVLKYVTTTSDNTPLDVSIVERSFFFELHRSINSKWQFLACATIAFSEQYVIVKYNLPKNKCN